ncbi:MAG: hypothetical protein IJV30_13400 [Oscillospiraceae bacterium]|nr:hypothetical protein [Oscillospiraceae bacterium]
MKEYKKVEHAIKADLRDTKKKTQQDMHELKKQVKAEAREIKRVSDEKAQVLNVEKEIHKERLEAEREH